MTTTIIGIDCATKPKHVGLAHGSFKNSGVFTILEVDCGENKLLEKLGNWVRREGRVLLTLDAPLGWPDELSKALADHKAGEPIRSTADKLFRRLTDQVITERCSKRPLDVGADRIARTAHAALWLLNELGKSIGGKIPLAWTAQFRERVTAIEVYPAVTLKARGIRCSQYKKPQDTEARKEIVRRLNMSFRNESDKSALIKDADILDATVCALAGADFLREDALPPDDERLARREGWIWSKISSTAAGA
ncbi:MAG: DUF429 domain-containing protein [Acidobacteria bacterium]|nr:DUF429 domain-containing protein [Acidobacteriota bacterium]